MLRDDTVDGDQSLVATPSNPSRGVEFSDAPPVRLQTLDLARNIAIAPDGKRYVVATYDDTHVGGQFISAVYPQQNGYLTLIRLTVGERRTDTVDQAFQLHKTLIQAVQQGKVYDFFRTRAK